jgi:hypothetical protein
VELLDTPEDHIDIKSSISNSERFQKVSFNNSEISENEESIIQDEEVYSRFVHGLKKFKKSSKGFKDGYKNTKCLKNGHMSRVSTGTSTPFKRANKNSEDISGDRFIPRRLN